MHEYQALLGEGQAVKVIMQVFADAPYTTLLLTLNLFASIMGLAMLNIENAKIDFTHNKGGVCYLLEESLHHERRTILKRLLIP